MLNVALTGNIAAGKSTVAAHFAEWGATVIDADAIVRGVQRPGTPVFDAIVSRFGPGAVAADGSLDRAALRARLLASPEDRRALEAIVHPAVEAERRRRLLAARASGVPIVVNDIPLLFEAMDPSRFEVVVLVDAPEPLRRARLVASRGITPEEAEALVRAQLPAAEKRSRAHLVVDNDGSREQLRDRAWLVWRKLVSRSRQGARARA
jgi:dephospho-CoA kinase